MTLPPACDRGDETEGGHALDWLTADVAYCAGCDLVYARQPGALVWLYDPWFRRLADALAEARFDAARTAAGASPAVVAALMAGDDTPCPEARP